MFCSDFANYDRTTNIEINNLQREDVNVGLAGGGQGKRREQKRIDRHATPLGHLVGKLKYLYF